VAEHGGFTAVLGNPPDVIDEPRQLTTAPVEPEARGRGRLRNAGWALAGAAVLGVSYIPAARVPIIADDFQALQETFAITDGSFWEALTFGFSAGQQAGHSNPVGQTLGALYHYLAYWISANVGVSPQYYDVLAALGMIALGVAGAASALVWGLSRLPALRVQFWPTFALLAAVTAATLQLHVPWSDDPVVSYGPAGWGSTAIGFWTIAWALRAVAPGNRDRRSILMCSALAAMAVWYYEMLVGAVAAVAVALVLTALTAIDRERVRRRCLVLMGTAVLLPAMMFVAGRVLLAVPSDEAGYGGTALALGRAGVSAWGNGMLGALPGGGWGYLTETAGAPALDWDSLQLAGALVLLVGGIGFAWVRSTGLAGHRDDVVAPVARDRLPAWRSPWLVPVATLLTFWAVATATHAMTVKYSEKMARPGQVYLSYAVGVICVAALIVLALVALRRYRSGRMLVIGLPMVGAFVLGQATLNMTLADITQSDYPINAQLVAQSADGDVPEFVRCGTLFDWMTKQGWPEYYLVAVRDGVQENYERMYGEPFCAELDERTD
jgi:hypothetical protein